MDAKRASWCRANSGVPGQPATTSRASLHTWRAAIPSASRGAGRRRRLLRRRPRRGVGGTAGGLPRTAVWKRLPLFAAWQRWTWRRRPPCGRREREAGQQGAAHGLECCGACLAPRCLAESPARAVTFSGGGSWEARRPTGGGQHSRCARGAAVHLGSELFGFQPRKRRHRSQWLCTSVLFRGRPPTFQGNS